jgi:hypothetical protein
MATMSEGRRLTRRDALSGAAALGAGVLLRPGAARAASDRAGMGGRLFSHDVGTIDASRRPVIATDRTFCLAGVRWAAPRHADIELRTRRHGGRWGPWGVASSAGHEGDAVPAGPVRGQIGEPLWTGPATELQLRARGAVRGVSVQFVAAEHPAAGPAVQDLAGAVPPLATPTLPAGPGQPPIIARRVWAGADHPPTHGPFYGTIEMGVVHHTENPNGYARADVPAMLRAIYEFHVYGRRWFDIGYNYVVDRFGRIWEARQGGIDLPVIGAQAGDWNQISFGVSVLGTFTDILPSPPALAAVQRLIAWKMALNGVPVIGEISAVVGPDGISWTQFRVGEHVRFPRIAGHRDVDSTDCPGDVFYRHLPAMRPRIKRLAGDPPTLELGGELAELVTGPSLVLTGRLVSRGGQPIAAGPVEIETVVGRFGHTRRVAATSTDSDGRFAVTLTPSAGLRLRALHAARPAVVSQMIQIERAGRRGPTTQFEISPSSSASSTAPAAGPRARRPAHRSRPAAG